MKFQLKSFWLFLLTFVLGMQQQQQHQRQQQRHWQHSNHKQLSSDCCCCAGSVAAAEHLQQQQEGQDQLLLLLLEEPSSNATTEIAMTTTRMNLQQGNDLANEQQEQVINEKEKKEVKMKKNSTRRQTTKQYEQLYGDIATISPITSRATAAPSSSASPSLATSTATLTISSDTQTATATPLQSTWSSLSSTLSLPKSMTKLTIKRVKGRELTEKFPMDFRESVAKFFANEATAATTATTSTLPTVLQSNGNATMRKSSSPLPLTHQTERRHVVPEKLQYTKEIPIKQGRLMGIIRHFQPVTGLRDVDQYLGLPYAEAPVGSRRFMPPGAPVPWKGLKIARHLPPVCPQKLPDLTRQGTAKMSRGRYSHLTRLLPYLKAESEDCLYLNLYVPHEDILEPRQQYPVLVYLHGESFEWNSGNAYDGSVLASYGQVIVVTVNYRLGVFGFLRPSFDEQDIANFALLDQIAALHWIKENIGSFGGDNGRVTLMGHSQGAACVNYLMVSPVASGLFHRAILMSGSAMSDWASANHTLQLTMQLAHTLECPLASFAGMDSDNGDGVGGNEHELLLECLRQRRYQDILSVPTTFPQFSTSLGPIVDGHVIPNQPYKVMGHYTEHFSRYDLLFGVTESESYHTLGALALDEGLRENERDNLLRFYMQSRFDVRPDLALAATLKKYQDMYTNPIKATNLEHRDVVLDILSDARIVGPLMQTGLFHADVNRRNFMYVFGHNSASGPHASLPHSITGEELAFIFGAPLAPAGPFPSNNYSTQEKLLSEAVMAYWTNFVKTGHPKAPWQGTFLHSHALEWDRYDMEWPEFNKRTQAYLNIGIPPSIGYKYRQIYMNFWNKELPDELNQIAAIQEQQQLQVPNHIGTGGGGGTSTTMNAMFPLPPVLPTRLSGNEVITGHMSKYGMRDNGAEDPVRTLKLLLQEPLGVGNNVAGPLQLETADNMYNAPPTFGQIHKQQQQQQQQTGLMSGGGGGVGGNGGGLLFALPTQILHHPSATISAEVFTEPERSKAASVGGAGTTGAGVPAVDTPPVAKSETTLQLLIGLIVVFIVLNVLIYSTFLLQKRRKATNMKRKLGVGGILSYEGTTDDELKRRQTKPGDGDDSYILDVVRKSNTYEAIHTERRSPINGYKITRQLSASTVDTHTKVSEWMAGAGGIASTLPRHVQQQQQHMKHHTTPTFSTLSSNLGGGGEESVVTGGSFGSPSHKVNVAINGEPSDLTRLKADGGRIIICQDIIVADHELLTPQDSIDTSSYELLRQHSTATEPSDAPLHQYSRSDPVDLLLLYQQQQQEDVTSFCESPARDINVTSRDAVDAADEPPLTPAQQLAVLKQRNYPKVLPTERLRDSRDSDSPPMTADLSLTYKRNSLPPNSYLPNFLLGCGRQAPAPPPRTISTLGRKPSCAAGRRNSNNITTSPLRLAQDCGEDDDENSAERPITQNTLIVGPIVPKTPTKLGTLGRKVLVKPNEMENCGKSNGETATDVIANEPVKSNAAAAAPMTKDETEGKAALNLTTPCQGGNSVFQSFESVPPPKAPQTPPGAHHTERVYAIGEMKCSPPSWPAPNGDIYAQPVKSASKTSLIPRMLPLSSNAAVAAKDNHQGGTTITTTIPTTSTTTATTTAHAETSTIITNTNVATNPMTTMTATNTTNTSSSCNAEGGVGAGIQNQASSQANVSLVSTPTRIPQSLHRNLQTTHPANSMNSGPGADAAVTGEEQNQINKDKSNSDIITRTQTTTNTTPSSIITTAATVASSAAASSSSPATSNITTSNAEATPSTNKRSASSYSTASSTSSCTSSNCSSCCSSSSSSESSTGTVRTELLQQHKPTILARRNNDKL